jgi:hypothetical protein
MWTLRKMLKKILELKLKNIGGHHGDQVSTISKIFNSKILPNFLKYFSFETQKLFLSVRAFKLRHFA